MALVEVIGYYGWIVLGTTAILAAVIAVIPPVTKLVRTRLIPFLYEYLANDVPSALGQIVGDPVLGVVACFVVMLVIVILCMIITEVLILQREQEGDESQTPWTRPRNSRRGCWVENRTDVVNRPVRANRSRSVPDRSRDTQPPSRRSRGNHRRSTIRRPSS